MNTTLPIDSNSNPIPVLSILPDGGQKVAVTAASARNATNFQTETRVVSLYATEDMYIQFGNATVTSNVNTAFFLAKGVYKDFAVNDRDELKFLRVAAIRATVDGTLYVHERT